MSFIYWQSLEIRCSALTFNSDHRRPLKLRIQLGHFFWSFGSRICSKGIKIFLLIENFIESPPYIQGYIHINMSKYLYTWFESGSPVAAPGHCCRYLPWSHLIFLSWEKRYYNCFGTPLPSIGRLICDTPDPLNLEISIHRGGVETIHR